ncbi:hypothetical protein [Gordonia sp. NB41Y]|uniref:hypothetical protein n=1 Tax=Gordonia sp. NB41Y TaxID=875808 RepID=UPI0002BFE42F|nr:hypothetical protein [Gordonia sp. NB41Y]EMP10036.1 hypothetical protein ISGA_1811 [Gordonia sp. NB41Y]WLP90252.1 hypothetical protein Q9K23_22505 [Gordonia sp. NB41Y]
MIYRVVRPLVVVRSHGEIVYRTAGQEVDGVPEQDAERLVRRGMIVPVGESSVSIMESPGLQVVADAAPAGNGKPKRTAPLSQWQQYAKAAGLSEEDIDGATKAELIAALS